MERSMTMVGVHCQTVRARLSPVLAALTVAAALGAAASPASAASSYCSPTGDFCLSAKAERGIVRLRLDTFSFTGKVEVCVSHGSDRDCARFTLRPRKSGLHYIAVRWSRHFPNHGPGTYTVRFRLPDGTALGRSVTFKRG
jgi:hypothetical protein